MFVVGSTASAITSIGQQPAISSTGEEVVAKWVSVANHVQNVHTHDRPLLISCLSSWIDKWWTAEEVVWTKFVVFLNS